MRLNEKMEEIEGLLTEVDKVKDGKNIQLSGIKSQIEDTNRQIQDIEQQIDRQQKTKERNYQLSALENEHEEIMQSMFQRKLRTEDRKLKMQEEKVNEQRLKQ